VFDDVADPNAQILTPLIADLTAISHDGKVVVVGTAPDGVLYYTVRQSGFENSALTDTVEQTLPGFENWKTVPLGLATDDPSVRAHEMAELVDGDGNPITRSLYGEAATASAVGRVKLISGLGHLYLFRVSADHRLLLDRFVLDGLTNELVAKLEVRFRRSEQRLVPDGGRPANSDPTNSDPTNRDPASAGGANTGGANTGGAAQDSLGFRDLDQNTFFEPTQELSFVGTFSEGKPWFSVELLPTSEHERFRWNIFAYIDGTLRLISVAASAQGLIDPTDQAKVQQDPDKIDRKIVRTVPGIVDRELRLEGTVAAAFDSTLYHNQVERLTKAGPQLLKENTRVMLSVPVRQPGLADPAIAAVSFSVNNLGQLSQIDRIANSDEMLRGTAKEVLLPINDLEEIKLIADRTPPPEGSIAKLSESQNQLVSIETEANLEQLKAGQQVKVSGTRSYDGVYVATAVDDGTFEVDAVFDPATDPGRLDQGYWEVVEDDETGLVFENMIAGYERTATGGLRISCLSHNISEGDEIRISGSVDHDGVYPVTNLSDDNTFELDRIWPTGEVVNLSRRPRRGLHFDGKGDYLEIDPIEFPAHRSADRLERQISAWVNLSEITDQPQTIFATTSDLMHLYVDRAGRLTFVVRFADGHRAKVVDRDSLPVGSWVHVTAMFDYEGETTGETAVTLCRGGAVRATETVDARKPLHLPLRNLKLKNEALPVSTVQYNIPALKAVTMEAWVSTRATGRGVVASWYQGGRFELAVSGDRTRRVVEWTTGGDRMRGMVHLPNDDWHHIAVSYDPASNQKTIHVNGEVDSTKQAPAAIDDADRELAASNLELAKDTKKALWLGYLGASAAEVNAKGWDVNTVRHRDGALRQVGTRRWRQLTKAGATTGDELIELDRDELSVYLKDTDDSYRIRLDLGRRVVDRTDFNVESAAGEIVSSVAVNGYNTNRVDYAGGSWQRTDGNTWEHFDTGGNKTGESRDETQRDAWSVYFSLPDGRNQFDLWRKKIIDGHGVDLHDITGSAAPAGEAQTALNGANVRRIDVADGYYETTDGQTWTGHRKSGAVRGGAYREVTRGEWSVTIASADDSHRLTFDLWDKSATRTDREITAKLHDIDSAAAPAREAATGDRFDGFVADVRVWSRARSNDALNRTGQERLTGTERGLVAHWPLGETSGAQLADLTKSKAHVTVQGDSKLAWFTEPHRAPGERTHFENQAYTEALTFGAQLDRRDRYAMELDGEGGHLQVPTLTEDLSGGFTVAAWARWDEFRHWGRIIDFGNGPNDSNILLANFEKTKRLILWTPGGEVSTGNVLPQGEWVHVAATVDEVGGAALYINGEATATGSMAAPDSATRTKNYIGRSNWDYDPYFKGAMRDVQFWGRALEGHEVKYYMNTPASGVEDGLLHHWPMRTATIKGKRRVVDQGTAAARHAEIAEGATSERLEADVAPTPLTELRGKLSDVQLWTVNRPVETIRETMHDQLTGNEYGLTGYWRCGGLLEDPAPGATRRISPDFASQAHDAVVVGDTYVSACELPRFNSVGRAVKFTNDDLVAVTQGARYRESFEFRATDADGDFWTLAQIEDADGRDNRIFEVAYWGQRTRTSTDRTTFKPDEPMRIMPLGDGWFRAECDVTIPDQVSLIRSFELDEVTGLWSDEQDPPDGEWLTLSVRKHRLALISDSVSRRTYVDPLELPTLVDSASELADAVKQIPAKERSIAAKRVELSGVLEELLVFANRTKFEDEQRALTTSNAALTAKVEDLDRRIGAFAGDELNYRYLFRGRQSGKVLDFAGPTKAHLWDTHGGENQAWEFHAAETAADGVDTAGQYFIVCVSGRRRLAANKNGDSVYLSNGSDDHHRWTVVDLGGEYRGLRNVGTGGLLDVYAHRRSNGSLITTWARSGQANQAWSLRGWYPGMAAALRYDAQQADAVRRSKHVIKVPIYHHFLFFKKFAGYLDVNRGARQIAKNEATAYGAAAQSLRAAYPTGRQKKSTYDSELGVLTSRRKQASEQLTTDRARLAWLRRVLASTTPEREAALLATRDRLEQAITTLQDEINRLNTDYVATAKQVQGEAQTMSLVAEDQQGLKTYGAVLGFAAPITGVTCTATAEGNVQLGYFDTEGRMRFTDYDATSDSANASYEQWVPSTVAVCPDLSRDAAKIRLDADDPIVINPVANTTEAWFYYPMPFQADGSAYPVNVLTSDADGTEAAIAVADNRRLGTVVDGFFHDAGIDLAAELGTGWHHVAARSEAGVTVFFLDGKPVGRDREAELAIDRHAMSFAGGPEHGTNSHLGLSPMDHNYDNGFSIQGWVRWDSFSNWSPIIDWGSGVKSDNIGFSTWGANNALSLWIYHGDTATNVYTGNVLQTGRWHNVAASVSGGIGVIYLDGEEVARGEIAVPNSVRRTQNRIGLTNWYASDGYRPFHGAMSDLHVWNRGLSAQEIQGFMYEPPTGDENGLLHHWKMRAKELGADGELMAEDSAAAGHANHGWMGGTDQPGHGCVSHLLDKTVQKPIAVLGNQPDGGAPVGKLAEVRVWSDALTDEVIEVNSRTHLTGNEPELEAYYPLDDIMGPDSEADDRTGMHRPAALEAGLPVARTAKIGNPGAQVVDLDGTNSAIELNGADLNRSHTVEFLLKRSAGDRSDHLTVSGSGRGDDLQFVFRSDGLLSCGRWDRLTTVDVGHAGVNDWIHVALVYNSRTKSQTVYLDGRPATVAPATSFVGNTATAKHTLRSGDRLVSANGRHQLIQQPNGRLEVLTEGVGRTWSTNAEARTGAQTVLQNDGNWVTYHEGVALWVSFTNNSQPDRLMIRNDGIPVLMKGYTTVWEGGTSQAGEHPNFRGQVAELRVWDHARTADQIRGGYALRAAGGESGLVACLPFDAVPAVDRTGAAAPSIAGGARAVRTDDLPIAPGPGVVTAEYSTVGVDPLQPTRQRAVLRRFFGFADIGGSVSLLPGKPIEELTLKWIGNAQFEPTLLGFMEGAPPVPSENLTVNYDYDAATSVELVQSEETMYSWNRNRDIGGGLDANFFLGGAWGISGGAFIKSKITEGHVGARGNVNSQWRRNENSTIRASSTEESRDRLDLRGSFELDPKFPHLGNRFVPKNVGYALVVSGLADVFITQMKRTGRMVAYEVLPVEDVPPDVNTITFMINPAYTLNGSLDGLVGSHAADQRFFQHVPEMRAQYGSRYPASYYNLEQAYDLKAQIDRWDKDRESYFVNFDARETGLSDILLNQVPDQDEADDYGQVEIDDGSGDGDGDNEDSKASNAEARERLTDTFNNRSKGGKDAARKRRAEIEKRFSDQGKQMEANAAFVAWQRRMEGLQIRAAKRNIVNTYVWDADGGIRFEEQSFANTIEHTIGGSFSLNASLGLDANVTVGGFKFELQAMGTFEMSQTMSKTASSTTSFDLNVRLDGVEKKGVTDSDDYPLQPGEKVDRYRFMSFYLEGDVDHFNDFFNYVVDPEWLLSNDEEARALRQVARGRPNKAWRVMHRVTYVERPALMGFGRDLRTADDLEQATEEVFNYFDALEQNNDAISSDIGGLRAQLTQIDGKLNELSDAERKRATAEQEGLSRPQANGASVELPAIAQPAVDPPLVDLPLVDPPLVDPPVIDLRAGVIEGGQPVGNVNGGPSANGVLDINTATAAALEAIDGIGPSMAAAIIDLRTELGGFTSLDQLVQVSGIGQSTLAKLAPQLTAAK
jgi:competence ComEA-like helix-hairpin-helix protein